MHTHLSEKEENISQADAGHSLTSCTAVERQYTLLIPFFTLNEDFLGVSKFVSTTLILDAEARQSSSGSSFSSAYSSTSSTDRLIVPSLPWPWPSILPLAGICV